MKASQQILPGEVTVHDRFNKLCWKDGSRKKKKGKKTKIHTTGQPQNNEAYTQTQLIFIPDQRCFEVQIDLPPNSFSTGLSLLTSKK